MLSMPHCHALHQSYWKPKRLAEGSVHTLSSLLHFCKIHSATAAAACWEMRSDPHTAVSAWFISSFQAQAWCLLFPAHCGNITGKEKHNGSAEAVQVQSEGPGASFSETETQTTVKQSLELDPVLQEEGLLRVQTVNHPKKIRQLLFSTL